MTELKKLGDVCSFTRGKTITAKNAIPGNIPVIAGGQTPSYYHNYSNRTGESIVIAGSGAYAGFVSYWNQPIFVSDAFTVNPLPSINKKYVYHWLKMHQAQIYATQKGAGVPHVHGKDIAQFEIPIPSLSEQKHIVGILDTFTASIDNLKEQITQRRKQYEYYRDQLLDLKDKEGVVWKSIEEIGYYFGGLTGKTKKDFEKGNAKFITYMNVFSNPSLVPSALGVVYINEGEKQNTIHKGDILFTGSSETPQEAGMSCVVTDEPEEDFYMNSFCFGLRLHNENYNLHYYKHLLRSDSIRKEIIKSASGVTRFNISKSRFSKIRLPFPSLSEQNRIVSILDTFESSIKNLEAQLDLRQKQYEYYRNKLLTFE